MFMRFDLEDGLKVIFWAYIEHDEYARLYVSLSPRVYGRSSQKEKVEGV